MYGRLYVNYSNETGNSGHCNFSSFKYLQGLKYSNNNLIPIFPSHKWKTFRRYEMSAQFINFEISKTLTLVDFKNKKKCTLIL